MGGPNTRITNNEHNLKPTFAGVDQVVTVSTTAVGIETADLQDSTQYLEVQVQAEDIRVRYDGTDPTTLVGFIWTAGTSRVISRAKAFRLKMIRDGAADSTVHISELTD